VSFNIVFGQVVINEFSCSNYNITQDNYGQYEDWVELYNSGGTAFNLAGYYLSDDINNTTMWQFPAGVSVPAGGFIIVWASGRDEYSGGNIHTNFRLTQQKPTPEYLVFANSSGTVLESYNLHNYITQMNNSNGRATNGATTWSVFTNPTPGASNSTTSYARYADKPVFSISGGFYPGPVSVSITTTEPNAVIRYTTNGDLPDASSFVYSTPINITNTTIVIAKVFSNNTQILPGQYEFNTFFINVNHTVPVVSIAGTNVSDLLNGSYINPFGCIEYYETGQLKTKVTGEFNKHGNDSWAYGQRGIDFISRDEFGYGDALRYKIFAAKSRKTFKRIILKAAANDNYPFENGGAHIRDAFVQTISQRGNLELDERSYEPCVLYMNGQYWGVYDVREKVDDQDFTSYYYNQDRYHLYYLKTWGSTWSEYGGAPAQNDWDALKNYILSNNMGVAANFTYVQDRLNLKSLVDYFIINEHTVCKDWLNWNTSLWKGTNLNGQELKWRYTLWDMDATFGHYINYTGIPDIGPTASPCYGENLPDPGGQGHTIIMKKLMDENPSFKQFYLARYVELINGPLQCDTMIAILDELINRIQPEMQKHINKWGGSFTEWQNNVQAIRDFIIQRCAFFTQGFVNCYSLTGPFNVVFKVTPNGAGKIKLNSSVLPNYPFNSTFYGGIQNNLQAIPNSGYAFDHWEIFHNTLSPNNNTSSVTVTFNSNDTIIAHFVQVVSPKNLTFKVEPPNSGTITVNGFTPVTYPWSGVYTINTNINLTATAGATYNFSHWTLQNHTILPGTTNPIGSFLVLSNDTITAYFTQQPALITLDVNVMPPYSGEVLLNNSVIINPSHSEIYSSPTNIDLKETAKNNCVFSHWEANNHVLLPNNLNDEVTFLLTQNDHVIAYFNPEEILVFLPNSFSPNSDGLNDKFSVYGNSELDYCEIYIYSRWGELIFSSKDVGFVWDGKFKGELCPMDAYSYVFIYSLKGSDQKHNTAGSVVLMR